MEKKSKEVKKRVQKKQKKEKKKLKNKCELCGKGTYKGSYICSSCKKKNNSKSESKREVCVSCGKKTNKGNIICSKCNKINYNLEYYRAWRSKNRNYKDKIIKCLVCGSYDNVRPYVGLCSKHYRMYLKGRIISK